MKFPYLYFSFVSILLVSCGGGGSGSDDRSGLEYTGETSAAQIDENSATKMFSDLFISADPLVGSVLGVETSSAPSHSGVLKRLNSISELALDMSFVNLVGVSIEEVTDCEGGGAVSVSGELNESTNLLEASLTFNSCLENGVEFDGEAELEGILDSELDYVGPVLVDFNNLSVVEGSSSLRLEGSVECRFGELPVPGDDQEFFEYTGPSGSDTDVFWCNQNLLLEREGKVYRFENLEVISIDENLLPIYDLEQISLKGRYFDPDIGYVDVSGPEEFQPMIIGARGSFGDLSIPDPEVFDFPIIGGVFIIATLTGLNGSSAEALSDSDDISGYNLYLDSDGDGNFDSPIFIQW